MEDAKKKFTIGKLIAELDDELVMTATASEIREALGWAFGSGQIVVDSISDGGEVVWRRATGDEMSKL